MIRPATLLKQQMDKNDISCEELSQRTNIKQSTMMAYIYGNRHPPIQVAIKIARAIGCSVEECFEED